MVDMIQQPQLLRQVSHKVKISVDDILEKYDCPICMCKLTEPYIAKCGHTFCKGCIQECVNRQHECPQCRAKLTKDDLFRNFSLEVLLQKLQDERDREQHSYFNNLANNAIVNQQERIPGHQDSSPIETVFMLNLRESLLGYQEYFEGLQKEKVGLQKKVKTGLAMKLLDARQGGNAADQQSINQIIEEQMRELDQKFNGAIDALVQSYDEHMKKILPKPKLLPIRISIAVESKVGLKIENIHVKPYDNINDLFKIIEEYQHMRGDPILDWNKGGISFLLTGPLRINNPLVDQALNNGAGSDEAMEMDLEVGNMSLSQQIIIKDWTVPFSKFNVAAGSLVTIIGGPVQFNSDKPLECMTLLYDKDPNSTFNYFSCKTCGTNWICENCKDGCHSGHNLLPHLLNHRPTWACCYCMKKDLCKISNKKNPKGKH